MKSYHITEKQERMSLEECLDLGRRSSEGDPEARETLILSHIYLIESILAEFCNKGADPDDLFQEGCYGLLKAVDLYDYKKGVLFSTYAVHWIRKQMRFALRTQSIDKPVILKDKEYWLLMKVCTFITRWTQEHRCKPSCEIIAEELNLTLEQTAKFLQLSEPLINIEDSVIVGFKTGLSRSAEEEFFDNFLFLDDVPLTYREKIILSRRLGCTSIGREETLKEIAASMGLSYETVRLDYRLALDKVKTKILKQYKFAQNETKEGELNNEKKS